MRLALQEMSKKSIDELSKDNLVSINKSISEYTWINYILR
jgi:hypothetical protein